ncbi:MAG: EpsI family protein [Pirellulales bacterium]|nr:EpsI family protein [Pirellulales bacterium]
MRLIAAAAIVLAIYGAMYGLKAGIQPPQVVFPAWCRADNDAKKALNINLPYRLGAWSGTKTELDPKIFDATGAKIAENRSYADDFGHTISLHIAYYDDVDAGVWHSPTNCYRCNGWQCREEEKMPLKEEGKAASAGVDSSAPEVYFTRWDKEQEQCLVMHWYYLEGRIFYDRFGLGAARVALRGRSTWPPMIKVLIQGQINAVSDDDKENLLNFSKEISNWLNEQSQKSGAAPGATAKAPAEKPNSAAKSAIPAKAEKSD